MSEPRDFKKALERYARFHDLSPNDAGRTRLTTLPDKLNCAGTANWVAYRSAKWTGKFENYIHDHEVGVHCYMPRGKGELVEVPSWIRAVETIVRLGDCLGFSYDDVNGDEVEAKVSRPYPELYCTPDGDCLLVVAAKRKLVALMWGGYLSVEPEGIVG